MPDMKRFLEVNTSLYKGILIFLAIFALVMVIVFTVFMISEAFPFFMILPLDTVFILMGAFCIWIVRKSDKSYYEWWNNLSEEERAEIERDYSTASKLDSYMLMGEKYVFFHRMGKPIPYEQIDDIYFLPIRKQGWNMLIILRNGEKHVSHLPVFTSRLTVLDELQKRCRNAVFF